MDIAGIIRQWLSDIKTMEGSSHATHMLVFCVNWAESPVRMLTDKEHHAVRRLARFCRKRLAGKVGWHESENGRLWV